MSSNNSKTNTGLMDARIPVLKLEKLSPEKLANASNCKSFLSESSTIARTMSQSVGVGSPCNLVESNNNGDEESPGGSVGTAASTATNNSKKANSNNNSSSSYNNARKIIQSIFGKPKKEKSKRGKRGRGRAKKLPKVHSSGYNKSKMPLVRKSKYVESDDDDDEEVDKESNASGDYDRSNSLYKDADKESEDENVDDEMEEKKDDEDNNSVYSKRSDEELGDDWKPMRAAMVAAMELVAKNQVTDDMRSERRRKYAMKSFPKGRGRRTIFKRMSKPMRSSSATVEPHCSSWVFADNQYMQVGDIVCLNQDLEQLRPGPEKPGRTMKEIRRNLKRPIRFFQVQGFLKGGIFKDCASLLYLERNEKMTIQANPLELFFSPYLYRRGQEPEIMVDVENLKFVMHWTPFWYSGNTNIRGKPEPGAIYTRAFTPVVQYETFKLPKKSNMQQLTDMSEHLWSIIKEKNGVEKLKALATGNCGTQSTSGSSCNKISETQKKLPMVLNVNNPLRSETINTSNVNSSVTVDVVIPSSSTDSIEKLDEDVEISRTTINDMITEIESSSASINNS